MVSSWITRQWQGTTLWHLLLIPLGWVFGLLAGLRRTLYRVGMLRAQTLPVPVIVIGNISAGGTGKTPLVAWLARELAIHGWHPGVISRGYGGSAHIPQQAGMHSDTARVGDEPVLLASLVQCPVWVGRDRAAAGRALLVAHPEVDVLISDDGLQHYRLARAVEIAVVDGARGFGNGRPLPAGPLREPVVRLGAVDAIVVNQPEAAQLNLPAMLPVYSMRLEGACFVNLADPSRSVRAADFVGQEIHAIAGIGHPQRFFDHIAALGIHAQYHAFPDHHAYRAADLAYSGQILMTSKDAVKCSAFAAQNMWALPVQASIQPDLLGLVLAKLGNRHG
ncbi:tetraacyldisaccharide 4'-kinase [Sulfuriferula plumbiphila]|uniref:Tetraacyldisaccharide 4'-kinase n=1 Tax=Sulfuriferula plumbiphila TaxID=171865 RepID=A0A512L9U3_9PROT|nr:tetraacyldisaccharide 4'-kinase [Sulfuriferula plumbiphila]BBP03712.1 tetraacyldisaccharide 4'-kinase [Sulfuriferula plumbiphila]GEP31222.1 tetraacyldisaccharide 4'-kinase [Sulfuriferula plumbiphila]